MLLVGKPGSGKTTLLKQLLTNPQMYYRKFDDVLLVSPSHAKMGLKVKNENTSAHFDLDWIFSKFDKINEDQLNKVFGHRLKSSTKDKKSITGKLIGGRMTLNDGRTRFLLGDMFKPLPSQIRPQEPVKRKGKQPAAGATKATQRQPPTDDEEMFMQKRYEDLKKLPREQQEKTHRNILLVLDDVVGSIKKAEYDPRLAQLVMNRRHIIFNGTISIVVVTQKYTLIPSRIRSNANWIIMFQLNPADFELAYRDSVVMPVEKWRMLLNFIFNTKEYGKQLEERKSADDEEDYGDEELPQQEVKSVKDQVKGKKFENIGIWVELNMFFKNFKRVNI